MSQVAVTGNGAGTGVFTLTSPNSNTNRTITLPDATTTLVGADATQTLTNKTINGGTVISGTAVASTSGTSIDFTSIPSWVKRITVVFSGVSTNSTSGMQIQLGDSGGIEATGYAGSYVNLATASLGTNLYLGAGFMLGANVAANSFSGSLVLNNISGNLWVGNGFFAGTVALYGWLTAGNKSLSDTLTTVRITTLNGTDTFDAGSINILYE